MSNMSNLGSLQPASLDAFVEKLNGAVSKVSKLRLFLDGLETELNEIRQQYQNEISVLAATNDWIVVEDTDSIMHCPLPNMTRIPPASPFQGWNRDPEKVRTIRKQRKLKKRRGKTDRHTKRPEKSDSNPVESESKGQSTPLLPISGVPSSSGISGGSESPAGDVVKGNWLRSLISRSQLRLKPVAPHSQVRYSAAPRKNCPIQKQIHPPRPPTHPFPFPENINLSSYPPQLKYEGHDWFVLYNPLPKVERVLYVNLVHALIHKDVVHCVHFSQDGKWLATGSWGTARIYNVKTGLETCNLDHVNNVRIWSVRFSPHRRYLATGTDDRQIRVWNIAKKQVQITLKGHRDLVFSLCFSPNGQFIVSGSNDGTVRIWNVRGGVKVLIIDDHYLPHGLHPGVLSVALSPDGRYVAVGGWNTVVSIWEITTGTLVHRFRGHRDGISCVAFMPDGLGLISGSYNETLKFWDVSGLGVGVGAALTSTPLPCVMNFSTGHDDAVCSTAVSHDGAWVVSGSEHGRVLFWDARTGVAQCMLSGHENTVHQVDLSPRGNLLATASEDGQVRIWNYGVFGSGQ